MTCIATPRLTYWGRQFFFHHTSLHPCELIEDASSLSTTPLYTPVNLLKTPVLFPPSLSTPLWTYRRRQFSFHHPSLHPCELTEDASSLSTTPPYTPVNLLKTPVLFPPPLSTPLWTYWRRPFSFHHPSTPLWTYWRRQFSFPHPSLHPCELTEDVSSLSPTPLYTLVNLLKTPVLFPSPLSTPLWTYWRRQFSFHHPSLHPWELTEDASSLSTTPLYTLVNLLKTPVLFPPPLPTPLWTYRRRQFSFHTPLYTPVNLLKTPVLFPPPLSTPMWTYWRRQFSFHHHPALWDAPNAFWNIMHSRYVANIFLCRSKTARPRALPWAIGRHLLVQHLTKDISLPLPYYIYITQ